MFPQSTQIYHRYRSQSNPYQYKYKILPKSFRGRGFRRVAIAQIWRANIFFVCAVPRTTPYFMLPRCSSASILEFGFVSIHKQIACPCSPVSSSRLVCVYQSALRARVFPQALTLNLSEPYYQTYVCTYNAE